MPISTRPLVLSLVFASACIIVTDGDGDGTDTGSTTGTTTATSSTASTSSSDGTATTGTGSSTSTTDASGSDTGTAGSATTGGVSTCGWGPTGVPDPMEGYVCGGSGEDPNGTYPLACPDGLEVGGPCGDVTGVGCCDANGDLWYCTNTGQLFMQDCG
ncbi:MAG: hypothetical protein D6705_16355 [Deltaproteobacteria bacterium]|nr:MAG: hypothetical protein D6705_16355 [Deltaproteobacteria bacterium]